MTDHEAKAKAIVEKLVEEVGDHGWVRSVDVEKCLAAALAENAKADYDEAEHYRIEASNVYLANENLQAELAQLRAKLAEAEKPLLSESDLIEYYKTQMVEHRENAIANRKRAEQAEAERDAAYVQGLERAKEIIRAGNYDHDSIGAGLCVAIQAEIDKAKK